MPMTLAHLREFNPNHVPAGSPEGGQFTSGDGGGGAKAGTSGMVAGGGTGSIKPYGTARRLAREYVASQGREYTPSAPLTELDPVRMAQVANAYDAMKHAPDDPQVAAAYKALASETIAQYNLLHEAGLRVEPAPAGGEPYHGAADVAKDVRTNNHMYYYPTTAGFGSSTFDAHDNPLLADSGLKDASGRKMLVNDVFRVVHDYFGHIKDGNTFRPLGEENAWRSHMAMYSPLAAKAMTSEARGQNAWVYFGPYGATNRAATSGADIHFADQKTGIMEAQALREARDSQQRSQRIPGGILHPHHWEPPAPNEKGTVHMEHTQLVEAETSAILRRLKKLGIPLKRRRAAAAAARIKPEASTRALREAGLSERDVAILVEGHEHERQFCEGVEGVSHRANLPEPVDRALTAFQEAVSSDVSAASTMAPPTGWTERADGAFSHSKYGSLHLKPGRWTHRDVGGLIRGSGVNQESLTGYLRGLGSDPNTAAADGTAAEALDTILARIRGTAPAASAAAHQLVVESRLNPRGPDLSATHDLVRERLDRREPRPTPEATRLIEALRTSGRLGGSGSSSGSSTLHDRLRKAVTR